MSDVQVETSGQENGTAVADTPAAQDTQDKTPQQTGQPEQKIQNGADQSIAAGTEKKQQPDEAKPYWPEDWRQKAAEHASAGDKKAYEKELKRLERIADPAGLYGMYREAEGKLTSGRLIPRPGKDAKPEEIAEFHKALGVPEKAEDYFKDLKLENGAVLGDQDMPIAKAFAEAVHEAGAPPAVVNKALNWYFKNQEEQAAQLDERDDSFRSEAEKALKEEFGPAFKRKTNAISSLFEIAPGGADVKNEAALYARLMGGRMADGQIIGNDPDMVRFLVALAMDKNPSASVVEDGDQSGKSVDDEIASIEKRMRDDRPAYFKDEKAQARYRELLSARDKIQSRQRG
jgi:hypothetical protein